MSTTIIIGNVYIDRKSPVRRRMKALAFLWPSTLKKLPGAKKKQTGAKVRLEVLDANDRPTGKINYLPPQRLVPTKTLGTCKTRPKSLSAQHIIKKSVLGKTSN